MLLHTSSSLLRAWGYFFPVCYWGATFEMQPGWAQGIETSAPGLPRNPQGPESLFNSQRWVECSRSFNHFSSFLSSAGRGTERDKLDFSLIWNPERLGWPGADHTHSAPAYLKTKLVSRVHSAGASLTSHHFDQMWTVQNRGDGFISIL